MIAEEPDSAQSPYHRVPAPWIVFVGTLSLFVGLNLQTFYLDSSVAGFPFTFFDSEIPILEEVLNEWLLLADIAIAIGAAAGLTYLMRNGWREFWHWLRTAGVMYASQDEDSAEANESGIQETRRSDSSESTDG